METQHLMHCITEKICSGFLIQKALQSEFAQIIMSYLEWYERMHTIKCRNSIWKRLLLMKSADIHSMVLFISLVDTYPLLCEYGINTLLRVTLNGVQDLNFISWLTPESLVKYRDQPCKTVHMLRRPSVRKWAICSSSYFCSYGGSTVTAAWSVSLVNHYFGSLW